MVQFTPVDQTPSVLSQLDPLEAAIVNEDSATDAPALSEAPAAEG